MWLPKGAAEVERQVAILALATSGPMPVIGLRADGTTRETAIDAGRGRGRDVAPTVQALLGDAGLGVADLDGIVVDVGPGSFTGVRVGVTTAKTLAWAANVPLHAVDSLRMLAVSTDAAGSIITVRDAGRGTVYHAAFDADRNPVHAPARGDVTEVQGLLEDATIVGEGAPALVDAAGVDLPALDVTPSLGALIDLIEQDADATFAVAAHDLAPLYLQASAPERLRSGER